MMKISVAIPTISGREKYLKSCLMTCVAQDSDALEILVSDNSDGGAEAVCRAFGDSRIKYIRPRAYLPMSAHWDFVLQHATGDSISIIGDDDGLMPGCIAQVTQILKELGNVPVHHSMANYHWPDFPNPRLRNVVVFYHPLGSSQRWKNSTTFLKDVAEGRARYVEGPMIYHNFVPLALVRSLFRDGVFFRRASPDLYSAIAIAANTKAFYSVETLLTIFGQGARANGASVRNSGEDGARFLSDARNIDLYAPRFESKTIQLQLLDALLEVAETFSMPSLVSDLHLERHLWRALREVRQFPAWRERANELSIISALAFRDGKFGQLLSQTLGHTIRASLSNVLKLRDAAKPGLPASGQRAPVFLGAEVLDIYTASLAISKLVGPK